MGARAPSILCCRTAEIATSLASVVKTLFFTEIGYLQDRRLAQGLLELLKSRGMFLSTHDGNPLPFESMKDVSELANSRYKAGVESDHPE